MSDIIVSHDTMKKLAVRSSFQVPESGIVFFGFRGLLPLDLGGTDFARSHNVRQVGFNHTHMRCTIGQWQPAKGLIALFPGSTVPDIRGIEKARNNGGSGANMLMLGSYAYDRGVHKPNADSGHRAFRQGMFFPVWRTTDDLDYDLNDQLDTKGVDELRYPWDNLHCAYADNVDYPYYSSSGCQVVAGRPSAPPNAGKSESGPWKRFIENAYGPLAGRQTRFTYMLFSGAEVGKLSVSPDGPLDRNVRFGSTGEWVVKVQEALKAKDFSFLEIDQHFGRDTLEAVIAFQEKHFGKGQADGVVGPNTANALGVDWPSVAFDAAPELHQQRGTRAPPEWKRAAAKITSGFETSGDPYIGVEGDFDNMGISCGALQWNIGQGSLQPMVRAVGEPVVTESMPTLGGDMWEACTSDIPVGLSIVRQWQDKKKLSATAHAELRLLMGTTAMRGEQDLKLDAVALRAFRQATQWAVSAGRLAASKREFCWFFEIVTQNGNLKGLSYNDVQSFIANCGGALQALTVICEFLANQQGASGHVKDANKNGKLWRKVNDPVSIELLVASYLRSKTALPQWRHVVVNRKGTVATGGGWVNSLKHDFSDLLD